jgi:hypothetical protein
VQIELSQGAELQPTSAPTLKKYGLSLAEWSALAARQGGVCAICRKLPTTGRLVIDHLHAKGWKKMEPDRRKTYVRGLLCWFCNYYLVRKGVTPARAHGAGNYLTAFALRTQPQSSPVETTTHEAR